MPSVTTIAKIRETTSRRIAEYRRGNQSGQPPDRLYIVALDEATGGYWSAIYTERRQWIDWDAVPLAVLVAILEGV